MNNRQITIDIPESSIFSVTVGTLLAHDTPLYTISDTEDLVVPVTSQLRVNSNDIFNYVTCVIGDKVKKNDILASKKGIFGTKKIHSPVEGVVSNINHATGDVTISVTKSGTRTFSSPVEGKVLSIDSRKNQVSISIPEGEEFEVDTISATAGGKISNIDMSYTMADMALINNKVVVVTEITPASASKFETLDAVAIVYHSGTHDSKLPHAKIKNSVDIQKIISSNKQNLVLLPNIKRIIVY